MKELALIALLGGGDFSCGDTYFSKGQFDFIDMTCQMETHDSGLCHMIDNPRPPFPLELALDEHGDTLTVSIRGKPVGTCG